MHNFWLGSGILLLIIGLGVLTFVGGLAGIPTLISLLTTPGMNAGASPLNLLQGTQITFTVVGAFATIAGMA